jgi:hypothetical protein
MTENEACKRIKYRMHTAGQVSAECGMKDLEMAIKALEEVQQYRQIGTVEVCREAVEKQTAISRELIEGKYFCPKCHNLMPYPGYCGCGQKVY